MKLMKEVDFLQQKHHHNLEQSGCRHDGSKKQLQQHFPKTWVQTPNKSAAFVAKEPF